MDYSKWLSRSILELVQNVQLWILATPILLLMWFSRLLSGVAVLGFQARMARMMNNPALFRALRGANTPGEVLRALPAMYAQLLGIRLPALVLASGIGFIIWLLMLIFKGSVIHQTMPTAAERPRWQESLHVGLNRAPHIFLIDLLLALPVILLFALFGGLLLSLMGALMVGGRQVSGGIISAGLGLFCLSILIALFYTLLMLFFKPLTYQACVQERRPALDAIKRAAKVFGNRAGPVLVLGVISIVISIAWGILGGMLLSPVSTMLQFTTGALALVPFFLWLLFSLIYTTLSLAIQVFALILYTSAWPELVGNALVDD